MRILPALLLFAVLLSAHSHQKPGELAVEQSGFWCDVKAGILTYGAFGESEASATENARSTCRKMHHDHEGPRVACKSAGAN